MYYQLFTLISKITAYFRYPSFYIMARFGILMILNSERQLNVVIRPMLGYFRLFDAGVVKLNALLM